MLWNTSHLLLLDPDKLHFTDLMFHREDAAPDRLGGRRQSQVLPVRSHVLSLWSFCILHPKISYDAPTQKVGNKSAN